jgi:hypothetical protein
MNQQTSPPSTDMAPHSAVLSLDEAERAQCAALARWLDTSSIIGTLGLFAAAIAALWMRLGHSNGVQIAAALALALVPIERIYALRLRFDRGLFADLADKRLPNLNALDAALSALGLRKATAQMRPLADRIRGTQGLWRSHAAIVGAQVLLCLFALVLRV